MIASMMRAVSAADIVVAQGHGCADTRSYGRRAGEVGDVRQAGPPRPHLLGAPQPDRDDRAPSSWPPAGPRPSRPFSTGSKNASPRGIVPWGISATSSPASSASAAAVSGSSEPRAPLDPDAAHGPGELADDRRVEHLLLAEEADRAPALGDRQAHRGGVEVAAVVGDDDGRARRGMCSMPAMSKRA